jgi:hypothetical protein
MAAANEALKECVDSEESTSSKNSSKRKHLGIFSLDRYVENNSYIPYYGLQHQNYLLESNITDVALHRKTLFYIVLMEML